MSEMLWTLHFNGHKWAINSYQYDQVVEAVWGASQDGKTRVIYIKETGVTHELYYSQGVPLHLSKQLPPSL